MFHSIKFICLSFVIVLSGCATVDLEDAAMDVAAKKIQPA
jgi:uncharacterized protein YceK